jgi:hypothetical protein
VLIANDISDMGALSKIIFGGDEHYISGQGTITPESATLEVGMTEADFSSKYLGVGGAIIHRVQPLTSWFGSKKIPRPDSHEDACMH